MDILSIFKHTLMISYFVFVMMLLVDFLDMSSKGAVSFLFSGGRWRQYALISFLGSIPGCLGSYSFVQDGHGMLPLLSYNLNDAAIIKAFNLVFGLLAGGSLFFLGL
ncbi:MAG: hypothetical protein K9K64_04190 [Desulfohalobiaceae bacterium]|nr:hypothetical protein [Desulfohalobiaceae bacterium]